MIPPLPNLDAAATPIGGVVLFLGVVAQVSKRPSTRWSGCRDATDAGQASAQPAVTAAAAPVLIEALGWMVCDGRSLDVARFPGLYAVLGTRYGTPGPGQFCLPDLRGAFVRGVDAGAGVDPDAGQRRGPDGSGKDGGVGSLQCDALQSHTHTYDKAVPATVGSAENTALGTTAGTPTSAPDAPARVSSETRPINVAVYYIIRYR